MGRVGKREMRDGKGKRKGRVWRSKGGEPTLSIKKSFPRPCSAEVHDTALYV